MEEVPVIALLCLSVTAVLFDLASGRIPNGVIAAGLACALASQVALYGPAGLLLGFGGMLLPPLLFGVFYYFRMIGAGDVKLFCVVGGFCGPSGCLACIAGAVFLGGVISLVLMLRRRSARRRLRVFLGYVGRYLDERRWSPYLEEAGEDARFSFSVPILLGVLCHIGGVI